MKYKIGQILTSNRDVEVEKALLSAQINSLIILETE